MPAEPRGRDPMVLALSLAGLGLLWALAAGWRGDPLSLPGPGQVAAVLWHEAAAGPLLHQLAATLRRVAEAFALAFALGAALGLALGRYPRLDAWADPWLIALLNLPALVTIVLCYLWIGLNEAAAVAAVALNKLPLVAVTLREGARALDPRLDEMARLFRMPPLARLRHVVLPQLASYLAASVRGGLSVIWKIVLVVEFLGRPDGVGFEIHLAFELFDIARVLAYALAFIAVMLAVEIAVLQPWERAATRWRSAAA